MTQPELDAGRFKAMERAGFNRIATRYAQGAHLRADLAEALLRAADLAPGQQVLDLASGPGLLARDAARLVQPGGWVLATDIAEAMMIEASRVNGAESDVALRASIGFATTDAEHLCLPDASFDRVLIGLALFMFPDEGKSLKEIRRVLRPGGRLAVSVWGPRASVPLISCAQDCIARVLPPPKFTRPSVFRLGEDDALTAALTDAGFDEVRVSPCRFTCHFPDASSYWQGFLDLAGGVAESMSRLPNETQALLRTAVESELDAHRNRKGDGFTFEAAALIGSARA
ncbi:MAG TPA: class I SAM-dependent methyltransferase [Rhodocyclaceae bacterium]|nr:class I SAM-dependent methyltransferase [Rhodocyclaceae bacterium]HRQ45910.1 class I SAM-dependent methyltransferase [Rhodocyclaceae bacterium]